MKKASFAEKVREYFKQHGGIFLTFTDGGLHLGPAVPLERFGAGDPDLVDDLIAEMKKEIDKEIEREIERADA